MTRMLETIIMADKSLAVEYILDSGNVEFDGIVFYLN